MHSDCSDLCSLPSSQQTLCNPSAMSQLICVHPDLEGYSKPPIFLQLEKRARWFHVHLPRGAEVHQVVSSLPGFSLSLLTTAYLFTHFPSYVPLFPKSVPVFFPSGGISSDLTCVLREPRSSQGCIIQKEMDNIEKDLDFESEDFIHSLKGSLLVLTRSTEKYYIRRIPSYTETIMVKCTSLYQVQTNSRLTI